MGADERLFGAQKAAFPELETPRWLPPQAAEDMTAYARRFAASLGDREPVRVLGGVSFGGVVALEMAQFVSPQVVLLLAGAPTPGAIPPWVRGVLAGLGLLPGEVFKRLALLPGVPWLVGPRQAADSALFVAMLRDSDPAFLAWALSALRRWKGSTLPAGTRVFTVHGEYDVLFPLRRLRADVVIPRGGHLLPLSHPREVNALLLRLSEESPPVRRSAANPTPPRDPPGR